MTCKTCGGKRTIPTRALLPEIIEGAVEACPECTSIASNRPRCHCSECERHAEILRLFGFQLGRVVYASVGDKRTEQQAQEDTELLVSHAVHARWDELEALILDIKAMQE